MDMSQAYASTVERHLPHALIVFDRFHMMKLMNEKLDDLRRQLVWEGEVNRGRAGRGCLRQGGII
jgi:transposase